MSFRYIKVKTKGQIEGEDLLAPKLRFKEFKDELKKYKLKNIVNFYKGNNLSKSDITDNGIYPCILYGELYTKYSEIAYHICSKTNSYTKNQFISKQNDVLIPCSGETAIDISTSTCLLEDNILIGGDLNVLRPINQDGKYLSYLLCNKKRIIIAKYAQGDSIVHLYGEKISNIDVDLPSKKEQEKIADFLSLLDKKIELQQRRIEALKIYKRGLIQKLYDQKYNNKIKMKNIIKQKSIRNKNNDIKDLYSVNNKDGFILQSDQFKDRIVASEDTTNYKIIKKDYFAYNPARINVGSIARMKYKKIGIISPMYICFECKNNILPEYLEYFFETDIFTYEMKKRLEGSVRMCLSYESMLNIPIDLPDIMQQKRISKVLNEFDKRINCEEIKYHYQKRLKDGLLQKMFI